MRRWAWIAGLAALLLVAIGLGGSMKLDGAQGTTTTGDTGGITVTGNGTVNTVPDRAEFSFGVHTESATAAAALGANGALMTKVIDAVEKAGVAKADIQTSQVSLSPQTSADGKRITGYAADNTVSVTIRDLGSAGAVIDAAVAAGANEVSGPNLTSSDQNALYLQALKKAMADAKAKAEAIASGGGISLGAVTNVVEGGTPTVLPGVTAGSKATPISPGTEQITATVTATYAIS
ncbi:MAG: SIMPL domain-containing protein [Gaiellaceae bacterium]